MKCTNCGREIAPGAIFCSGCGMKTSDMTAGSGENVQSQQTQQASQSQQEAQSQQSQSQAGQNSQQAAQTQQSGQYNQQQTQNQSAPNQSFNGGNYGYNPNPSMNMGYNPNMGMAVNQVPVYNTFVDNNGRRVPTEYRPIKAWGYFGYNILFAIPIVGFIFLVIYALGGTSNINLRNYARSFFCVFILSLIILLVAFVMAAVLGVTESYM